MKTRLSIPYSFLSLFIIVTLVFLSIAFLSPVEQNQESLSPDPPDLEVGSTTGITTLAFMISALIILPLLASGRKKK